MKTLNKHLVIAGLLATLGFAAVAQAPAEPPRHGRPDAAQMEQFRAQREARIAQRFANLKAKLQISPAQETSWNAWVNAVKPQGKRERPNREAIAAMSTPERIDFMRAQRAKRAAEMDARMEVTKSFYGQLSPAQQKIFDDESLKFLRGGRHHGKGHGPRA